MESRSDSRHKKFRCHRQATPEQKTNQNTESYFLQNWTRFQVTVAGPVPLAVGRKSGITRVVVETTWRETGK
jgi:hypothetical protein